MDFNLDQVHTLLRCFLPALARREHRGQAPRRLTEPGHRTWAQFRGNLADNHLAVLLAEDAAVRFPLPASPVAVAQHPKAPSFESVRPPQVFEILKGLTEDLLTADVGATLTGWARMLGLPSRFAGARLHKIQADTRVLELPGSGGQLAARALQNSPDAYLQTNLTVLARDWRDRAMAGLVAMELDAPHTDFVQTDPELAWATEPSRRGRFDMVFGLEPSKGGRFDSDTLAARFPRATIVLV